MDAKLAIRTLLATLLIFLFGVSCSNNSVIPAEGIGVITQTSWTRVTSTPTFTGTWETTISGVIVDKSTGTDEPIAGATIIYDVLHSYFPEQQEGRLNKVISDESGLFSLKVMVHDTDSIRILVEAQGFKSYEERFSGIDLVAGKSLEVELSPWE